MSKPLYEKFMEEKNTPLTKRFIEDSFNIMIREEPELEPSINDFRVVRASEKNLGTYSNENRVIRINQKNIERQGGNEQLNALEVIRHEMEHARALKKFYEGRDDIESLIINYSLRDYAMMMGMDRFPNLDNLSWPYLKFNKKENYEIDPGERLAEIKAWKYMVNFLKNQRKTDDLLTARSNLYYAYIRGYLNNRYYLDAPTYEFLRKTGMYHNYHWLKNRVDKKDYSFETRITYGLPITYQEHEEKVLKKVLLKKRERE